MKDGGIVLVCVVTNSNGSTRDYRVREHMWVDLGEYGWPTYHICRDTDVLRRPRESGEFDFYSESDSDMSVFDDRPLAVYSSPERVD